MGKEKIIKELATAYAMELETVQNYIANSVNLDGVRSDVIKKSLAADITAELGHAQRIAKRIKTMGGIVPGSLDLPRPQLTGGVMGVTFTEPGGVAGITYRARWSPDLSPESWTAIPDTGSGATHTFNLPAGLHRRVFFQYLITAP